MADLSIGSPFQEVDEDLLEATEVTARIADLSIIRLRARPSDILVGPGTLTKVTTSVGCSHPSAADTERRKVDRIAALGYAPDMMMDLSIVRSQQPLYRHIIADVGIPVGTLPHYVVMAPRGGHSIGALLDEIANHIDAGVSWITLHLAVTREIYEISCRDRSTPMTSRGGGLIIDEMMRNGHDEGILLRHLPEVLDVFRGREAVLSLGTAFRPATTRDALDEAHRRELALQAEIARAGHEAGVPVMLEPLGHMTLGKVAEFTSLVRDRLGFHGPVMTLGPIVTDAAVGEDHIANAIGAAALAWAGGADVVNSITREEHTGRVPSEESIMEGLRGARIAAHAVNIARFPSIDGADAEVNEHRARNYTCVVEGGLFQRSARTRFAMGCTRCADECPLLVNRRHGVRPVGPGPDNDDHEH